MTIIKIDRLIGILTILLQNEKVTAPYLAERFEVSRRTINRDIEDICKAGIPIVTLQGAKGGITVAEGYKIDKTIFTDEEIQAIFTGLKSLDSISETSKYRQLIDKFSSDKKSIYSTESNILIDLSSHYKSTLSVKIEEIRKAILERRLISFDYYYSKGESRKLIEPYLIVFKWSSWYVFGYCCEKNDFRMFKLNRLWNLSVTGEHFKLRDIPQEQREFDNYFKDEIMLIAIFDKSVKYRLIEEYGIECFSYTEEDKLLFKFGFTNKGTLLSWILSFGDKAEIIEPAELRSEVKIQAKNLMKKYL
ncbi:YafY family protein [Desnuesiella massiliensis]|uniref:helix-turn-helix transcriptional regulator n=1 Tax=Desnuesiella massiliensis TaxID=1650662 RepID=UPI000AEFD5A7